MQKTLSLLASLTVTGVAGVPNVFHLNDPAKSEQVNANFKYLDSAVVDHKTQLDKKADQTAVLSVVTSVGAKLDTAALTARLNSYATTGALSKYATTAALNAKMTTTDYVVSGHLKALGGLTGGNPTGLFQGSQLNVDTTGVIAGVGSKSVLLSLGGVSWSNSYDQWRIDATSEALTIANTASKFEIATKYLTFSNGISNFLGDVKIDGALTLKSAAAIVPDYVFESGYKLAPLSEVEAYTQANKHLPDVPSAKEIEAGGMDLAKMNLTLLRKVEELTLHAIAQEKRIQSLEAQIAR